MNRYHVLVLVDVEVNAEGFHGAAETSEKVISGNMGKPDNLRIIKTTAKTITAIN